MALAATGCPRETFQLGGTRAGAGGAAGGSAGSAGAAGSVSGGKSCGSRGLPSCTGDDFCKYPASASCGDTDKPGTCAPKPEACDAIYAPVCGCDGKTYGSECSAEMAGVSKRSDGECKSGNAASCGGLTGKACASGQYCDFPLDAICGAADATGTCKAKPQACRSIYQPVCGCDGKTYGNACEANTQGISVASEGECGSNSGQSCGGLVGKACANGQYCDFPPDAICGAADATGTCKAKPDVCADIYKPVCGCDDNTYGNACEANGKGISVASEGECASQGKVCGVRGAAQCADGEYCAYPSGSQCGAADEPGTCRPKPDICTKEFAEVCGCDGKTYGNSCEANSAGTSVAHTGACDSSGQGTGKNCGGIAGLSCAAGEYCNYAQTTNCGSGDQFGQCTRQPTGCTKEFHAVCGCDGKTYSNPCMAAAAGISIQSDGECNTGGGSGKTCGGLTGAACTNGEFCNFPESAQCGAADQTGKCSTKPEACTLDYTPVCGCDDKTYGNKCAAAAAGVSIIHAGEC